MINFNDIYARLKDSLNLHKDKEVANFLNINLNTLLNWKFRNSPNWDILLSKLQHYDLYYILYNVKSNKEISNKNFSELENELKNKDIMIKSLLNTIRSYENVNNELTEESVKNY